MNRFLKTAVLSAAVAATVIAPLAQAHAGGRQADHRYAVTRQNSDGDAIVAGILGLAIGAIAAGVIAGADDPRPVEVNPYRHPRPSLDREFLFEEVLPEPEPEVVYYDSEDAQGFEPWGRDWYRYCAREHQSFDPETGTYFDYDGVERFCVAE